MRETKKKLGYSSQMTFVISLIAGSVGTGNIWRFPRIAAQNGGAFVAAYFIIMLAVIIPVMMGEHVMGRLSRHGTPGAFRDIAGKKHTWMGTVVATIMAMTAAYYSVVIAWIVFYLGKAISKSYYGMDKVKVFNEVSNQNFVTLILFLLVLASTALIAYRGVSGIEKANKIFIPVLFVCLLISAVRSLTLPGAATGLNYMFGFEWSDFLNYKIWLEALTQAIWSAGPGWGLCITLAVFSNPRSDVSLSSCVNGLGDMFAALLAGLAVIPALFALSPSTEEAFSVAASGNNGLTFLSMTHIFETMPGGYLIGILFFLSLVMAGLSSNVCHFMIMSLPFADAGKNKKRTVLLITLALAVWGTPSALSIDFLTNQDWVVGQMMIIGVMFSCYAMMKFGTGKMRRIYINNPYSGLKIGKWWETSIKIVAPLIAGIMFFWWIIQSLSWDSNWWNPFGISNIGTFILQGGLMAVIAFAFNNHVADSIKETYIKDDGTFPEVPDNGFSN